ncbi:MAG: V4R domain-containing protein [Thermoplasmata archaeon]
MEFIMLAWSLLLGAGLIGVSAYAGLRLKGKRWKKSIWIYAFGGVALVVFSLLHLYQDLSDPSEAAELFEDAWNIYSIASFVHITIAYVLILMALLLGALAIISTQGTSEAGTISLSKRFVADLREKLEELYGRHNISMTMYSLGKAVQKGLSKRMATSLKYDIENVIHGIPDAIISANWTEKAEIVEYVPRESLVLRTYDNMETLDGLSSPIPRCHFVRGALVGVLEGLLAGTSVEAIETRCQSKGDDCCEFAANIYATPSVV